MSEAPRTDRTKVKSAQGSSGGVTPLTLDDARKVVRNAERSLRDRARKRRKSLLTSDSEMGATHITI